MTGIRFMPPRVPLVDSQGMITREWYRLFLTIMDPIVGGDFEAILLGYTTGVDPQLSAQIYAAAQDAGQSPAAPDLSPALAALAQDMGQMPPAFAVVAEMLLAEMSGLRDQVAELSKTIDGMRQGVISI